MTELAAGQLTGWVADDSLFGARLALVRQRMGWGNVKEAADHCGVPVESWRRWERDGRSPRNVVTISALISRKTGCNYMWLLTGSPSGAVPTSQYARTGQDRHVSPVRLRPPARTDIATRAPNRPEGPRRPSLLRGTP